MDSLGQHFLFFFALLGTFNGLGLAAYLWRTARGESTQRWLALLVLAVSVRTGKSVVFHFWPDIPRTVLQVGLTACFFIGPSLFFLLRSALGSAKGLSGVDRAHVAVLVLLAAVSNLFFPYERQAWLWREVLAPVIFNSWMAYLMLCALYLLRKRREVMASDSAPLLLGVPAAVGVIWLAYETSGFTSYIVGALSFTFVLGISILVFLRQREGRSTIEPYQDRRIPEAEAQKLLRDLDELMKTEGLYRDPTLNLQRLARRAGLPQTRLSQLLNDNNGTSFKQYLTRLRVQEAKVLLQQTQAQSLESVAEAAGFQSMSTFFSAFKKLEGVTPAAYRKAAQGS